MSLGAWRHVHSGRRGNEPIIQVFADRVDSSVQYLWPPQDPTRLPNPPAHNYASSSAFVYGNEGFNPALRPSNGAMRSRHRMDPPTHDEEGMATGVAQHGADARATGSESSGSRSSSPERYLSDYDDDGGSTRSGELSGRVRRGSEGWEVRPIQPWLEVDRPIDAHPLSDHAHFARPWEQEGRYNYYDPEEDNEGQSFGDGMTATNA